MPRLDPAPLSRTAAIVRNWRNVLDGPYRKPRSLQSPNRGLATRSRSFDAYFDFSHSNLYRLLGDRFRRFESGMVYTCEPGIYIREEKLGVRLEDDILITQKGPINLSDGVPVEADEIEDLMKGKVDRPAKGRKK